MVKVAAADPMKASASKLTRKKERVRSPAIVGSVFVCGLTARPPRSQTEASRLDRAIEEP